MKYNCRYAKEWRCFDTVKTVTEEISGEYKTCANYLWVCFWNKLRKISKANQINWKMALKWRVCMYRRLQTTLLNVFHGSDCLAANNGCQWVLHIWRRSLGPHNSSVVPERHPQSTSHDSERHKAVVNPPQLILATSRRAVVASSHRILLKQIGDCNSCSWSAT